MKKLIISMFFIVGIFAVLACSSSSTTLSNGDSTDNDDDAGSSSLLRTFLFSLPLFESTTGWNQTATNASVLVTSDDQILYTFRVLLGDVSDMSEGTTSPQWPYPDVSYDDFSVAIFEATDETSTVTVQDYEGSEGGNNPKVTITDGESSIPVPATSVRPPNPQSTDGDGHICLYNTTTKVSYDIWQATTQVDSNDQGLGGGITGSTILQAGSIDYFNVTGSGTNPDGYSSARATGVPLLAGLILPEDVVSGSIAHALAVSIPGPRNLATDPFSPESSDYFYPVSTTETDFYSTNSNALASGQRIRLKSSVVDSEGSVVTESELAPITQMFLTALRTYGAIVIDNATGFSFYAEDYHTANPDFTDEEVAQLIGASSSLSLDADKNHWQIIMAKLGEELEDIPFAFGSDMDGNNPSIATITTANFEVVTAAQDPAE